MTSAVLAGCSVVVWAQPTAPEALDASSIMARVAANQDRSQAERAHYVYVQHAHVTSRTGKTVRCEETTDSRVAPTPSGMEQQLLALDGRVLVKGKYATYSRPMRHPSGKQEASADPSGNQFDRELVEDLRHRLTDGRSRDGIGAGLFPLTSKTQERYAFQLVGRERMNGRDVFHVTFVPKEKDDSVWKGDAYIDTTAYEPVLVRTTMAHNLPFVVRGLLGTSLPGLGFTVIYAPQQGGVWFPVSFGTEFKLRVLFFLHREIALAVENHSFERTHVESKVVPVESAESPVVDSPSTAKTEPENP